MERQSTQITQNAVPDDRGKPKGLYVCLSYKVIQRKLTMMEITTTQKRDSLIEMFLDSTEGEAYNFGRLFTRSAGENTTELIAYGWNKIAEYNSSTDNVTVYGGHVDNISETVDRYVKRTYESADEREGRTVNLIMDAAPNVGERPPAESAQFINQYKSFSGSDSPVESWASEKVNKAVRSAVKNLM